MDFGPFRSEKGYRLSYFGPELDSLQYETDYLNNVFSRKNYNTDFVRRNTHSNTGTPTNVNSGPVTTATIPCIRGTSETVARIVYLTICVSHTNR